MLGMRHLGLSMTTRPVLPHRVGKTVESLGFYELLLK